MNNPNKPVQLDVQDQNKLEKLSEILGITSEELLSLKPKIELATNLYTHKDFTLLELGETIPPEVLGKFKLPVINDRFVHLPFNVLNDLNGEI